MARDSPADRYHGVFGELDSMRTALAALIVLITTLTASAQERFAYREGDVALTASPHLISLAFASPADLEAALNGVMGLEGVETMLPLRGRAVVRVNAFRGDEVLLALRRSSGLTQVHPVWLVNGRDAEEARYLLTDELVVAFSESVEEEERQAVLEARGLTAQAAIPGIAGAFLVTVGRGGDPWEEARGLERLSIVRFAHANWLRRLPLRDTVPNDPLFANEWHLKNTGQGGGVPSADIRAVQAWDLSLGAGATIAVIDTGVDSTHPDLAVTPQGFDPLLGAGPGMGDDVGSHGTSCAGVAAAIGDNATLVTGVAPQAQVLPIRLIQGAGFGTASEEAACFIWAADQGADVITNSWGPDGIPFPLPPLVEQSFLYCLQNGRGGLGAPIFWAAGNGNEDMAPDAYVSSAYTIAVGAQTNMNLRASYSDFGTALDILAPSSGGTRAINTLLPNGGWTLLFGGTSASSPCAAGVAALMISAAPNLTWSQIRDILRATAAKIQPAAAAYDATGHSLTYGFGRINADAAVQAAMATLPQALHLQMYTTGVGDIVIGITHMGPLHEFLMAFSQQIYAPMGTGPLFGVGLDAFLTLSRPPGTIPFHHWADANGEFFWGAMGLPAGLTVQATAVEITGTYAWEISNVVQVTF